MVGDTYGVNMFQTQYDKSYLINAYIISYYICIMVEYSLYVNHIFCLFITQKSF